MPELGVAGMAKTEGQCRGGGVYFGKSENGGGQRRCAALLLATPDFQTFRHSWVPMAPPIFGRSVNPIQTGGRPITKAM